MSVKGDLTFKFDKGINLRMINILEKEENCGIVLFGSIRHEGANVPALVVHEDIKDIEGFTRGFYELVQKHGVSLGI